MKFLVPFFLLFFLPHIVSASEVEYLNASSAYDYLNHIRKNLGMNPLRNNRILEKSAKNHARYLIQNPLSHYQNPNRASFTGKTPADRAIFEGYHSKLVTENFSSGQGDAIASIDGLMSAIYHRFGFLDFSQNEVGIGIADSDSGPRYVYNMGNDILNDLCKKEDFEPISSSYYSTLCDQEKKIPADIFDQAEKQIPQLNPEVIVWPQNGANDISPVFYDEMPDPLPDLVVSGYPVSIQFNHSKFKYIKLIQFKLYQIGIKDTLVKTRLLTHKNDPNQKFTKFQFALFPFKRLDWNSRYKVKATFNLDGKKFVKTWEFSTRKFNQPIFHVSGEKELINLRPGNDAIIYIPPKKSLPFIRDLNWNSYPNVEAFVSWEDQNTLRIHVKGEECDEVLFKLDGNRSFKVVLAEKNNWNKGQIYNKTHAIECTPPEIKGLLGFFISGSGETMYVDNGTSYWIETKTEDNTFNDIVSTCLKGTKVSVKVIRKNIILVTINGAPGNIVDFNYRGNRSFTLVINENQKP